MNIELLKELLQLGWPAIITVFFGYLAIQYIADQRAQIAKLWEKVDKLESELIDVKKQLLAQHIEPLVPINKDVRR